MAGGFLTECCAYIFMKSKSWIVWAMWIMVLLAALAGFGYTTYDRIATLISEPTSTTISIENMKFPAVTICTLNFIREDRRIELFPQNPGQLDEVVSYGLVDAAQCKSSALMLASTNGFN